MAWLRVLLLSLSLLAIACGGSGGGGDGDGDGDGDVVDAGGGAGTIPFMGVCDVADDQCAAGESCFLYGEGGMFCSHSCTSDADCAAPSRGCNNKGICKRP